MNKGARYLVCTIAPDPISMQQNLEILTALVHQGYEVEPFFDMTLSENIMPPAARVKWMVWQWR